MSDRGQLPADAVWAFIFAGKAIFTVESPSGLHRTFKVVKVQGEGYDKPIWTVMVLVGPDNNTNYRNIGYIVGDPSERRVYFKGNAAYEPNHSLLQSFIWVLRRADVANFTAKLGTAKVFHEGRCGKCGRRLTVPGSVSRGLGPQCALSLLQ